MALAIAVLSSHEASEGVADIVPMVNPYQADSKVSDGLLNPSIRRQISGMLVYSVMSCGVAVMTVNVAQFAPSVLGYSRQPGSHVRIRERYAYENDGPTHAGFDEGR
jgi:hypothetical protein